MLNDPSAWTRISPYLDQALDLELGERLTWLDQLEQTDPEIARTVRALLDEIDALNDRGYLESSPLQSTNLDSLMPALEQMVRQQVESGPDDWQQKLTSAQRSSAEEDRPQDFAAGEMLGVYRLIREIGHGGMSTVWLAERDDGQLKREVALKVPFAGPLRAQMAERFKRERDILATLTHPNIARLYDAGISESGQSYLAMEYVNGVPLTDYCDAARLSVRERLRLFLQVLAAVEFAHAHLVLHRDLKPSNILVTDRARVVLLDFGIAKLLSQDTIPDSPPTEMAVRALTPEYASPEHIAGQLLSTTSDVYSLGVALYELLAGARPFGSQGETRRELEEAILTRDPPRPSQLAFTMSVADARHTTPRKLAQVLKGDLDTILLKALKKAPTERYLSVGAFAKDLENHLGNLPVSALPDSLWYRVGRFTARYKLQVTAATITLLAIIGGGAAAVWQAHSAAQQRDRATSSASRDGAINEFMYTLFIEATASKTPLTVAEILERSEKLALADKGESRENRAALLTAVARLNIGSGENSKGAKLIEDALSLLSGSGESALRSALNCDRAVMMTDSGHADAALPLITREIERLDSDPETAYYCLADRTYIAQKSADATEVLKYARLALQRFHETASQPFAAEAYLLGQVGYGLYLQGDTGQATRYFELAQQKFTESGRDKSLGATTVMGYWATMSIATGTPKRALELYDRQLSAYAERDAGSGPPAAYVYNRGVALEAIGRYVEAGSAFERARRRAVEMDVPDTQAGSLVGLASLAQQSGDRAGAERYLKAAEDLLPSLRGTKKVAIKLAVLHGQRALLNGRLDDARRFFDSVLDGHRKSPQAIIAELGKAEVELMASDAAAAAAAARAALDMARSLQGTLPYSSYTGLSWLMLGRAFEARGDRVQAREAFLAAVNNLSSTVDEDHPELLRARKVLVSSD